MAKKVIINKTSKELAKTLGLTSLDAIEWEVRYRITQRIIDTVSKKCLTTSHLAQIAGTSRARITKILKNETQGISLDVLLRVLGATGQRVDLTFKKVA